MNVYVRFFSTFPNKITKRHFWVALDRNQNNRKYLRVIGRLSGAEEFNLNYYQRAIKNFCSVFTQKNKPRGVL